MENEIARSHPRYASLVTPIMCELDEGHEPPHRAGLLRWHDPPALDVGGEPYTPEQRADGY